MTEGHSIVDCLFGKYHVGRNQPQCKNCGGNHDEYISCNRAEEYGVKWKQELSMWEMYYDVEKYRRRKRKFKEVDLNPVYAVYKEWLTEEDEEELRQKKFWENFKDLSQFP